MNKLRAIWLAFSLAFCNTAFAVDVQISQLLDNPDPALRGGQITYSAMLLNSDNDTANNVTYSMPLPATTSFVSVSDNRCAHDGGTPGAVICNLGDVTGDGFGGNMINIDVVLASSAATGNAIAVTATVATTSPDANNVNDMATQNTTIDNGADLTIAVTDNADPVIAGSNYSYTLTAQNIGPNDANSITVVNTLPNGVSYQSAAGSGWSCGNSGQTVTCTRSSISNGATAPALTINAKVTGAITGTITDTATISATTGDPNPNNDTATQDTDINNGTDLSLSKQVSQPVVAGETTTFTLQPRNLGPFDANTVVITDTLPAGFTFISATSTGWACSDLAGTVTCNRSDFIVGDVDDITITTNVPASGTGINNTAIISSATAEANNSNNTGSVTFSIVPDGANLSISKAKTPDPVAQGENMESRISVTNTGPKATTGTVTVTDTLDANETYVSYSGTNWSCSHAVGVVTCTYSNVLADGENSTELTIVTSANITGNARDILTNTACVIDAGGIVDAVNGNDCASASVQSSQNKTDLSISKSVTTVGNGDDILDIAETDIVYTLTVTNSATSDTLSGDDTNAVVVTDAIPGYVSGVTNASPNTTGVVVNETSGAKFSCVTGSAVTCTLAAGQTFAPAETATFEITVSRPLTDGAFTNTANVRSDFIGETDTSNNSASVNLTVSSIADVEMQSIVVTPTPTKAGTNSTYVLTFRNNGPGTASDVEVLHQFLPPAGRGFDLISAVSTKGTCAALVGNDLTCSIGSMSRNETRTITLTVRPSWDGDNLPWVMGNTASISTSTTESDGTNNSTSQNVNVVLAEIDLLVNKTDFVDPLGWTPTPNAFPGSLDNIIVYKVDITNRGPSIATGLRLEDVITPKNGKELTFLCDDASATSCNVGSSLCNNTGVSATGPATIALNCPLPDMAADTSTTRHLFFRAVTQPDSIGDTHTSTATIKSNEDDTVATNNDEGETTSVRVRVDLAVTKDPSKPTVSLNEPFNWDIVVSNNGPGDSANSALADTLPTGMELTGTPIPSQGTCTGGAGDTSFNCSLQTIADGANATVTVPVVITAYPSGGTTSNTASVTTFGVDSDDSNDSDTGTVNVVLSTIAGTVFNDINDNGSINGSEHGIAGVTLTLSGNDSWGNAVNQTATTDADGNYQFTELSPGSSYTITQTHPANFNDGLDDASGTLVANSRTSDVINNISLGANTDLTGYNFGELGQASLTGFVWWDSNDDGIKDAGESQGIANVTLTLTGTETTSTKAISVSTTTDSNGAYAFSNLTAGTYAIAQTQPTSWGDGKDAIGSAGGNLANDNLTNIILGASQVGSDYNFGELDATISGKVYRDWNDNGTPDGGSEVGIAGVFIRLTGTNADGAPVDLNTTTDSLGNYQFSGLAASNGAGYTRTETQPSNILDGKDLVGSLGGTTGNDVLSAIVLGANSTAVNYNFGEGADVNSSLSGYVYVDLNDNGIKEAGEAGIANVKLTLEGYSRLNDKIVLTTHTSKSGYYSFDALVGSDKDGYTITQTHPTNYADGLDSEQGVVRTNSRGRDALKNIYLPDDENYTDYNFGELYQGKLGGRVFIDNNDDGLIDAAEAGIQGVAITLTGTDHLGNAITRTVMTDANGNYIFDQLPPSNTAGYTISEQQPADYNDGLESIGNSVIADSKGSDQFTKVIVDFTTNNNQYNFAELFSAAISGYVYLDSNDDGVKASSEDAIAAVAITLSGTDHLGNPLALTTQTDDLGYYLFEQLPPSDASGYRLSQTQPENFLDGQESIQDQPIAYSHYSDEITAITLAANQRLEHYNFGELAAGKLQGSVWVDANNNGQIDDNESLRIANVTITLTGTESYQQQGQSQLTINQSVVTDEHGSYQFDGLRAGLYTLTQTQPSAWMDGKDHLGSLAGQLADDKFSEITLNAGQSGASYDFGERGSELSGVVFSDLNNNGEQDAPDAGIPEVTIHLTGTDLDGHIVSRTVNTVITGHYQFTQLPLPDANGYTVTEKQPENMKDGKDRAGSQGGTVSNDEISQIRFSSHITKAVEYNFAEQLLNPAKISGKVWLDDNHNRLEDDGNGLADWTVQLLQTREDAKDNDNLTVIATVISDADGQYLFDGLSAGIYEVRFIHPDGGTIYGYPVSDEAGADVSMGTIRNLTLTAGEHIDQQNMPIDPSGVVYDSQTREPVAGASVEIRGPAGFDPARDLVGGKDNLVQTTDETGLYQFLLFTSAPAGDYEIVVTEPAGYLPGVSSFIPACTNTATVGLSPNPALVQWQNTPPPLAATIHDPANCPTSSAGFEQQHGSTQYYLTFNINPQLPSSNVVNNHIPLDPYDDNLLNVVKTAGIAHASIGELVPYTISVNSNVNVTLNGLTVTDKLPAGFKYLAGSASIDGFKAEPQILGQQLTWQQQTIKAGEALTISLMTVIGTGVGEGEYQNQAWALDTATDVTLSNIATANVRVVPEPLFDCSDIIGKVFDDKNTNGYQDEGERGLAGARIATAQGLLVTTDDNGRFHIACAAIPNEMRGSHFILKLDERTLPSGYRVTTENPRVVRLTRGKLTKANFGAAIHQVLRIQLSAESFSENKLKQTHWLALQSALDAVANKPTVLRLAYNQISDDNAQVQQQLSELIEQIKQHWHACECRNELMIEQEIFQGESLFDVHPSTRRAGNE
mgnify:CR=1 FL=1